jgi:hypothetical protein
MNGSLGSWLCELRQGGGLSWMAFIRRERWERELLYRRHQVFPSLLRMVNDNRRSGKCGNVDKNEILNYFNSSFEGDGNTA